jgi:hypothetical protein
MLLPLHTLLGVKLDNVCLVVDNARSPTDPVSFRKKQSCSPGDASNSAKSRWSSIQPCVEIVNKDSKHLHDTNCSPSMVELLRGPLRTESGETSSSGVPPVRIPIRQLSRDRIHKERKSPTHSPITKRKEKIKLRISAPLRPVRKGSFDSPVEAETSITKKMTLVDIQSVSSSSTHTHSRPTIRIPVRRRSSPTYAGHTGSPEQTRRHIEVSRDLAKLGKLARAGLIDGALET